MSGAGTRLPKRIERLAEAKHAANGQQQERQGCAPKAAELEGLRKRQRIPVKQPGNKQRRAEDVQEIDGKLSEFEEAEHHDDERYVLGEIAMASNPTKQRLIAAVAETGLTLAPELYDSITQGHEQKG